jgi:hypothetical protein
MAPQPNSRYLLCRGKRDAQRRLYLDDRSPLRYDADLPGTETVTAAEGPAYSFLAWLAFQRYGDEHLWWIIAEFQPLPIRDPTLNLTAGQQLYLPSARVVRERVLSGRA